MTDQQGELSQTPAQPQAETTIAAKTTEIDMSKWWTIFVPTRSFFFTPLIVDINIALFVAMTLMSGSAKTLWEPSSGLLIKWGANFKSLTLNGEWWRLLTSMFEHIGALHLLMNMYALIFVGIFLEPILGKARYIAAYMVTGVIGGLASLWWHDELLGAGASGAIFGLYGVFLALLTTNVIEQAKRKAMLGSIVIFVIYNLAYGSMKSGTDNAAHVGGLLSGLAIGYIYFLSFRSKQEMSKWLSIGAILVAGAFTVYATLPKIKDPVGDYSKVMAKFAIEEDGAIQFYKEMDSTTDEKKVAYLHDNILPAWNRAATELSKLDGVKLPEDLAKRKDLINEYVRYRITDAQRRMEGLVEKTDKYDSEIEEADQKIESIIKQLNSASN